MVGLVTTQYERIRRIRAGPIVVLSDAIDFLALVFPGREELARENVADRIVHHVQVIEDVRDVGIFFCELGTQFSRHWHKVPFHGRLVEIAMIGC